MDFPWGQSFQETRIDHHIFRLSEGADLVFRSPEVDARLPSYRCINHREQCSRHIDELDAALVN